MAKKLNLKRPLISLDLETTGLDVQNDRIVEISCVKILPDHTRLTLTKRLNPLVPIHPTATAVHGISNEDVADAPTFQDAAAELLAFLRGCDITGFNLEQFDMPMLSREFARADVVFPDPSEPPSIIDTRIIFIRQEPRDLRAAVRFFCGRDLENAHSAEADAVAAADVLMAQVQRYDDLPDHIEGLHAFCHPVHPDWIDPHGKIMWRGEEIVLTFGRHKNRALQVLVREETDYLKWITTANFSEQVIAVVRGALDGQFPQRAGSEMRAC